MLRGKKIKSTFYSHSRTKERTSGFKLSGPMWALNILNSIIYLLDAVISWSKKIICSMQRLGFINTVKFLSATITKHLLCCSYA